MKRRKKRGANPKASSGEAKDTTSSHSPPHPRLPSDLGAREFVVRSERGIELRLTAPSERDAALDFLQRNPDVYSGRIDVKECSDSIFATPVTFCAEVLRKRVAQPDPALTSAPAAQRGLACAVYKSSPDRPLASKESAPCSGAAGEPYCSGGCHAKARHALSASVSSLAPLLNEGRCASCWTRALPEDALASIRPPWFEKCASYDAVPIPWHGSVAIYCRACVSSGKARAYLRQFAKCVWCGAPLDIPQGYLSLNDLSMLCERIVSSYLVLSRPRDPDYAYMYALINEGLVPLCEQSRASPSRASDTAIEELHRKKVDLLTLFDALTKPMRYELTRDVRRPYNELLIFVVADALACLGAGSVDGMLERLEDWRSTVGRRSAAGIALGSIGDRRAVGALLRTCALIPRTACTALAAIGDPAAIPRIAECLTEGGEVASEAAKALAGFSQAPAIEALFGVLRGNKPDASMLEACRGIVQQSRRGAIEEATVARALVPLLAFGRPVGSREGTRSEERAYGVLICESACEELSRMGQAAVRALEEGVSSRDEALRFGAARLLVLAGARSGISALVQVLETSVEMRNAACIELNRIIGVRGEAFTTEELQRIANLSDLYYRVDVFEDGLLVGTGRKRMETIFELKDAAEREITKRKVESMSRSGASLGYPTSTRRLGL